MDLQSILVLLYDELTEEPPSKKLNIRITKKTTQIIVYNIFKIVNKILYQNRSYFYNIYLFLPKSSSADIIQLWYDTGIY